MKTVVQDREMIVGGNNTKVTSFGIDLASSAHLAMVLRDSIYTDKILAVLREYSANAWDAHREAGKGDVPIHVHLPTEMDPDLRIRDYGTGLSHDQVFWHYTQYGASGKRGTNAQVGSLGLGCKAGFAYADSFTVTSWYGGEKRIYLAVLDESDMGQMQLKYAGIYRSFAEAYLRQHLPAEAVSALVGDSDMIPSRKVFEGVPQEEGYWAEGYSCNQEGAFADWVERDFWTWAESCGMTTPDQGIEVCIGVEMKDIPLFRARALNLFCYFDPLPKINLDFPKESEKLIKLPSGYLGGRAAPGEGWVGVMGCIPYRIDISQIDLADSTQKQIRHFGGVLNFEIGEVQFNASREELKYSDTTKIRIREKLETLLEEYMDHIFGKLDDPQETDWSRRKAIRIAGNVLDSRLPERYRGFGSSSVALWDREGKKPKPQTFKMVEAKKPKVSEWMLPVLGIACLYIHSGDKHLRGYEMGTWSRVIVPTAKGKNPDGSINLKVVEAELEEYLREASLSGIPFKYTHELSWFSENMPPRPPQVSRNIKHQKKCFQISDNVTGARAPYSQYWNPVTRETSNTDVFVILERFEAASHGNFYQIYQRDLKICQALGFEMPPIYGYKSTERKPVCESKCDGIEYFKWREDFFLNLLTREHHHLVEAMRWCGVSPSNFTIDKGERLLRKLKAFLPQGHILLKVYTRLVKAYKVRQKHSKEYRQAASLLVDIYESKHRGKQDKVRLMVDEAVSFLNKEIPLIEYPTTTAYWGREEPLEVFLGGYSHHWIEYLQLKLAKKDSQNGN